MAKLSVVIPSRDERFLIPTIDDIFRNARGECEVVAVLDSNLWPEGWKEVTERHSNLHTIHNGGSLGMRASITRGVASAVSRGATYIAKFDGHCSFGEGFDEILKAECEPNWVVVPRRLRLDPEAWAIAEPEKPPYDYHYLSFPDDPNDFGGPGLNGKPWPERQRERADVLLDDEMSSQGSGWFMHAAYFNQLELMDEVNYGPFWNEFQEIGLKCWLSGGQVKVNKRTYYAHLHKGRKYGRGYRLDESALKQGRNHTMKWIWNEAWAKQTLPFEWLIDHFWPVPGWREDWREVLYAQRKPRAVAMVGRMSVGGRDVAGVGGDTGGDMVAGPITEKQHGQGVKADDYAEVEAAGDLRILTARYGVSEEDYIDVVQRLQSLVKNNSLDILVNNSTLTPGQNPFRGRKKTLVITYSYGGAESVFRVLAEKDWLIIGQAQGAHVDFIQRQPLEPLPSSVITSTDPDILEVVRASKDTVVTLLESNSGERKQVIQIHRDDPPLTATALNDYLIRKFSISPQRLRAPMPIELRDFHRNDLAQLFAELGFKRGAEIGVAEGNYSEVLLKANPTCELLLVDPWHAYSDNPQNKSKEKHEFAYNETLRKTQGYPNVTIMQDYSMNAVRAIKEGSLDFCYIDGQHQFNYVLPDIIEWSRRVRNGGVIALDDYFQLDPKRWGAGVVEAVQTYINAHGITPWWMCMGHKSIDVFWVKP